MLSAKARFVKMVIEGKIVIRKRQKILFSTCSSAHDLKMMFGGSKQASVVYFVQHSVIADVNQRVGLPLGKLFNAQKGNSDCFATSSQL